MITASKKAFTLIEMLIAMTVFIIFIGFVMGGYMTFHRAQQEAAVSRVMLLEAQEIFDVITLAVKENAVSYEYYEKGALLGESTDAIYTPTLVLRAGEQEIEYHFDEEAERLTVQHFDLDDFGTRSVAGGFSEPLGLHSENVTLSHVEFRIVPGKNPFDSENILGGDDSLWYQPNVQIKLRAAAPSKIRDENVIELQTSVTSKFYQ